MRIVDFFAHPVAAPDEGRLFDLSPAEVEASISRYTLELGAHGVSHIMLTFFDDRIFDSPEIVTRLGQARQTGLFSYSYLPNLRAPNALSRLELASALGFRSITLHPYLQRIEPSHYDVIVQLVKEAERLGMFVCLCSAYGSRDMYRYHSLPLAARLAEDSQCPIVLVHGGGAKILEALLLADAFPQIVLETSFSLSYWLGSSVETDFAFAMRKLGPERWLFGSDAPFVSLSAAIEDHLNFFDRHNFSQSDVEVIMGGGAASLLEGGCR